MVYFFRWQEIFHGVQRMKTILARTIQPPPRPAPATCLPNPRATAQITPSAQFAPSPLSPDPSWDLSSATSFSGTPNAPCLSGILHHFGIPLRLISNLHWCLSTLAWSVFHPQLKALQRQWQHLFFLNARHPVPMTLGHFTGMGMSEVCMSPQSPVIMLKRKTKNPLSCVTLTQSLSRHSDSEPLGNPLPLPRPPGTRACPPSLEPSRHMSTAKHFPTLAWLTSLFHQGLGQTSQL